MRIVVWGDLPQPTGFGRIARACARGLANRGHQVEAISMMYVSGPLTEPYYTWSVAPPRDLWNMSTEIINNLRPEVIVSCQDFPYHHTLYWGCKIDFSKLAWVFITPIDGTPIAQDWVNLVDCADGAMVISKFGVEGMRQQGKRVSLLQPGVDTTEFYPADVKEKADIRKRAGIPENAFVVSAFMMNQGRKMHPSVMEGFAEFCKDKPEALLYFDCEKESPAGWALPKMALQIGLDPKRILYRADMIGKLPSIRDRYALSDIHSPLASREGWGLPMQESMACGICNVGIDWCAATEQLENGRGILIPPVRGQDGKPAMMRGTWGGARDCFPDMVEYVKALNLLYDNPSLRERFARAGYEWAVAQTWETATNQLEAVIREAIKKKPAVKPAPETKEGKWPFAMSDTAGAAAEDRPVVQAVTAPVDVTPKEGSD